LRLRIAHNRVEADASNNQELLLNRSLIAAALAGLTLVSAVEARAQSMVKPVQIGVFGGVAIPNGDLSDAVDMGFNVGATVGLTPAMIPVGIRLDGAFNRFNFKSDFPATGNTSVTSFTGNFVYKIPAVTVSPYLIGGVGLYRLSATDAESQNKFGWNAGGGISMMLSGFSTFLEARFNSVSVDGNKENFIPITFGVMF
jgi:hypothetical protein